MASLSAGMGLSFGRSASRAIGTSMSVRFVKLLRSHGWVARGGRSASGSSLQWSVSRLALWRSRALITLDDGIGQ